jgi:hypothetical protein
LEGYVLPLADWFYKHSNDEYYDFIDALEERAYKKKLGLPTHKNRVFDKPRKIKPKKKKKNKVKKTQKYTNKNFRRYRQK